MATTPDVLHAEVPDAKGGSAPVTAGEASTHPAHRPIELWPEGVLALAAGVALVVIGYRHRHYLQRKAEEAQRMVEEFQRQDGVEEIKQIALRAADFLKG